MLVLKLIGKILLLPVWVILAITWLVVHILVSTFSIFHGFWKAFFTLFTILAIAFGMYQNVVVCFCLRLCMRVIKLHNTLTVIVSAMDLLLTF